MMAGHNVNKKNIVIIGIIIIFFFIVGYLFYGLFHLLYGKELLTRIDPVYCQTNLIQKSTKFLFIGDSRIAQWNIPDSIIDSNDLLNLGIDAQTSGQVLYRGKEYFKDYHADYTFIEVGINDLKAIGFFPKKEKYIKQTVIYNIESLIDLCINNQSEPVFISIFPVGNVELKRWFFWNKHVNEAIKEVNFKVGEYCTSKGIRVIDSYPILSNDNNKTEKQFQRDCLHINEKGYEKLNLALNNFLIKNGSK